MALFVAGDRPSSLPDAGRPAGENVPWWETPYGRARLAAERQAMERFTTFELRTTEEGTLAWVGRLTGSLRRAVYLVSIVYPDAFPDEPPIVRLLYPRLPPDTPHVRYRNRPCLYSPSDGRMNGYDPGATTAATLVAWTALWVHAFETWRATGAWPGRSD